mgnify:CR=1 FL=1|tara:strand:+ start:457 stop:969 length:513 start_codon:yes stop_codon:yes gene_type:complete
MSSSRRYLKIPGKRAVVTKRMIEDAISNTISNAEAARWLGISYNTYKKYSKMYCDDNDVSLFDKHKNQGGLGVSRKQISSKYSLDDILDGKYPDYPTYKLKYRLIKNGYFQEECTICGWNESRITDEKVCLHLDFIDENQKNHKYENLRLVCPNCYFTNIGDFKNAKLFC